MNTNNNGPGRFSSVSPYFRKYRWYLILGGFAILMANGIGLITPYITKLIIDHLETGASSDILLTYVSLALLAAVVSGLFRYMTRRTIIWMSRHIEYDLRGDLFTALLKQSQSFFHKNRTGDIMARMTNDLEAVRQMIGPGVMYISNAMISLIIGFSIMFVLSPKLTLMAAIPLIVLPFSTNRVGNLMHRRSMKVQEHFSKLTAAAQENLSGIRVVKAYCQEENEIANFAAISKKYAGLNMDLARLLSLFFPLMRLVAGLSTLSVLYFGGLEVMSGRITLGTMVAFFAYLAIMMWPVIALGWVLSLYQRGTASLDRINKVLFAEPEISNNVRGAHRQTMRGDIEFRNLRFSFKGTTILDGINLKIEAGQTIGIVGLTGSGKTTLVSLLARLHPVGRDQVLIDNIDINDWDLDSLRSQIGFAPQEPFLFSDSLLANICFGRDLADPDVAQRASETAVMAGDIENFPNKLQTMVGERGITLSGGQKQRTAIARAIVTEPSILILDDATSSVDTETEHEINERIKTVLAGRTAVIISHRMSAVKEADKIIYLRDGKIAEEGDHDALVSLGGLYAELYKTQVMAEELEQA